MEYLNNFSLIYCLILFILLVVSVFMNLIPWHEKITKKNKQIKINKVHFYIARDKNGELYLYMGKPIRYDTIFSGGPSQGVLLLPFYDFFGINKNDYDNLKWDDEPVEVFLNMED